jgi:hypothetical protein
MPVLRVHLGRLTAEGDVVQVPDVVRYLVVKAVDLTDAV